MKLSDYIIDFGRVVAYHPKLREIQDENGNTLTAISVLLLCQLLYWTEKGRNKNQGWIHKESTEIQEETGLSYNEQRTARRNLIELGLIEEHYRRSVHEMHFKVDVDRLNHLWEEYKKKDKEENYLGGDDIEEYEVKKVDTSIFNVPEKPEPEKKPVSEYVKAMLDPKVMKKENRLKEIKREIEKQFDVIADDGHWMRFMEFVYDREEKYKENLSTFIGWALVNGYDPVYWPPKKLKTLWPQAFTKRADLERTTPKIKPLPIIEENEDEIVDMPQEIRDKYRT